METRRQIPSMYVLRKQVEDLSATLADLVSRAPDTITSDCSELGTYVLKVKAVKNRFSAASQQLSTTLLKNGCIDAAQNVRSERHSLHSEVQEFIILSNTIMSSNNVDLLSNIDVYTNTDGSLAGDQQELTVQEVGTDPAGHSVSDNFVSDFYQQAPTVQEVGNVPVSQSASNVQVRIVDAIT